MLTVVHTQQVFGTDNHYIQDDGRGHEINFCPLACENTDCDKADTAYQNKATFLTHSLLPHAGVGSSKKLARRHASENLLARMEEEGMNTDPSLIKPKRKVCTYKYAYVFLGRHSNTFILFGFLYFLRNRYWVLENATLLEADV